MLGLNHNEVRIVPYNKEWSKLFEKEKSLVLKELRNEIERFGEIAIDIESISIIHVGSTSIKNMCAKPIIDIMLVLENFDWHTSIIPLALAPLGYQQIAWDISDGWLFLVKGIKENKEITTHLYHIVERGSRKHKDYLLLRDFLNNDEQYAKEYKTVKKELAAKYQNDRPSYSKAKTEIVEKLLNIAKQNLVV